MRQAMRYGVRGRRAGLCLGLLTGASLLFGCSHGQGLSFGGDNDDGLNVRPVNYKPDLLGAMHAYLNDPTGVRDAGIAEPALKSINNTKRYVVCVRFNAKKARNEYAGVKEVAGVFIDGRFDRFVEMPRETTNDQAQAQEQARARAPCADAVYAAFPELEKLSR
jgi:hypothetical protein